MTHFLTEQNQRPTFDIYDPQTTDPLSRKEEQLVTGGNSFAKPLRPKTLDNHLHIEDPSLYEGSISKNSPSEVKQILGKTNLISARREPLEI